MLTTTNKEYNDVYEKAARATYKAAHKRYKLRLLGRDKGVDEDLALLTMKVWALGSWRTGKFTHEQFTNKFNNAEMQQAFSDIKKLINGLQ